MVSFKVVVWVSAGPAVSLEGSVRKRVGGLIPNSPIRLWAGFSYSLVVEPRALVADYWLKATFSFLPCGPLHRAAYNMALASLRAGERGMQAKAFCDLILEVTHCSLCFILFARSKSLNLGRTQREGLHRSMKARGGFVRVQLRSCLGYVSCAMV